MRNLIQRFFNRNNGISVKMALIEVPYRYVWNVLYQKMHIVSLMFFK